MIITWAVGVMFLPPFWGLETASPPPPFWAAMSPSFPAFLAFRVTCFPPFWAARALYFPPFTVVVFTCFPPFFNCLIHMFPAILSSWSNVFTGWEWAASQSPLSPTLRPCRNTLLSHQGYIKHVLSVVIATSALGTRMRGCKHLRLLLQQNVHSF